MERRHSVLYGGLEMPRLFHYFFPRLIRNGKRALCFDGGNHCPYTLIWGEEIK